MGTERVELKLSWATWLGIIVMACLTTAVIVIPVSILEGIQREQYYVSKSSTSMINPVMEKPYVDYDTTGWAIIANGWSPWYVENQQSPGGHWYKRPEFRPHCYDNGGYRIYEGQCSQMISNVWSAGDSGSWQRIQVVPGNTYIATMMVYVWSSSGDDPNESVRPGFYRVMMGVHPYADSKPNEFTIWGPAYVDRYNEWIELSVEFTPWTSEVTIFTRANPWYGVKANYSFWDAGSFTLKEVAQATSTPYPTYTAWPTSTPYPTYTPQPTCVPCPTGTPIPGEGCTIEQVENAMENVLERTRFGVVP